jgi:hypothetical protein
MKTAFTDVLNRFETLSQLANSESESIHNLIVGPGKGLDAFSPASRQIYEEPVPCEMALLAFLNALPDSFVFTLIALLYTGRDNEIDPVNYWSELRKTITSKEHAISSLNEKVARMEYINKAISRMPSSIDLNNIPQQIASL